MLVREKKRAPRHKMMGGQPIQPAPAMPFTFPAPTAGWVQNQNLASPVEGSAYALDNWIPTTSGIEVRGGHRLVATLDGDVKHLAQFTGSSEAIFAATETRIYDVTAPSSATVTPTAYTAGLSSGAWSHAMFNVAGTDYLVVVNGLDLAQIYSFDAGMNPLTDEAVNELSFDALTADFAVGETLTGGASSATAEILGIEMLTATTGKLKIGAVTGGPFQDNETITSASGSATSDGTVSSATSFAFTGVATSALSHVTVYAERLFFVEKNSLKAWYLPVSQLGGAANSFSVGGVFRKGGSLLFISSISSDSGEGMDDRIALVSDEGEVAIYVGTNPAVASDWALQGVYDIPKPLGKNSHIRAGGDLLIATEAGIIPVSAAIAMDVAAVAGRSFSQAIAPYWQEKARRISDNWTMAKVLNNNLLHVSQPDDPDNASLCVNLQTGAWARWTGIKTQCLGMYDGAAYCGDQNGLVYEMDSGGSDNGATYTARYLGQFEPMGAQGMTKTVLNARTTFESTVEILPQLRFAADFVDIATAPPAFPSVEVSDGWDVGDWDEALWDGGVIQSQILSEWFAVGVTGQWLAPELQISSNSDAKAEISLVSIDATFSVGEMVT